jgi:hypothetical protein
VGRLADDAHISGSRYVATGEGMKYGHPVILSDVLRSVERYQSWNDFPI